MVSTSPAFNRKQQSVISELSNDIFRRFCHSSRDDSLKNKETGSVIRISDRLIYTPAGQSKTAFLVIFAIDTSDGCLKMTCATAPFDQNGLGTIKYGRSYPLGTNEQLMEAIFHASSFLSPLDEDCVSEAAFQQLFNPAYKAA